MKTNYSDTDMLTAIPSSVFERGGSLDLLNSGTESTLEIINRFGCWQMDVADLKQWAAEKGSK